MRRVPTVLRPTYLRLHSLQGYLHFYRPQLPSSVYRQAHLEGMRINVIVAVAIILLKDNRFERL